MPKVHLNPEEIEIILKHRREEEYHLWFNRGVVACQNYLRNLGESACGGEGRTDTQYHKIATMLDELLHKK